MENPIEIHDLVKTTIFGGPPIYDEKNTWKRWGGIRWSWCLFAFIFVCRWPSPVIKFTTFFSKFPLNLYKRNRRKNYPSKMTQKTIQKVGIEWEVNFGNSGSTTYLLHRDDTITASFTGKKSQLVWRLLSYIWGYHRIPERRDPGPWRDGTSDSTGIQAHDPTEVIFVQKMKGFCLTGKDHGL